MSTWYQPETPPPPPSNSASLKQILAMLAFGSLGSIWVIQAIKSQPGNSLGVGSILIVFALIFFVGLISKKFIVETVACGLLLLGAGGLIAITINTHRILWGVGAVFFLLCIVVIQLKYRFIDKPATTDNELRNPYS